MAEDAEVGELVDDDRLERLGRGKHEAPREVQPTLARGTPPSAALVADRHRDGPDLEGGRVQRNRGVHRRAGPLAKPALEHLGHAAPVPWRQPDDQLVAADVADPGDRGPSRPGRVDDPDPVQLAAVADHRPVAEPAAGRKLGSLPRHPLDVPAQPRFALAEEPLDHGLGVGPAAARRRRDRDDDPERGVDRDPQAPRAR